MGQKLNIMNTKDYLLLETAKLLNILNTWGNVLVPGFGEEKQVNANIKLAYCVGLLNDKHNMTTEDIEKALEEKK